MASYKWSRKKDPLDRVYYGVGVPEKWLGTDLLVSATFTPPIESELGVEDITVDGLYARAAFTGGVEGTHTVDVLITTNFGRVINRKVRLTVKDL